MGAAIARKVHALVIVGQQTLDIVHVQSNVKLVLVLAVILVDVPLLQVGIWTP